MATTINASTSSGLVETADTSGTLELQSNGTTKVAVSSTGVALTGASMTSFAGGAITQGTAVASTSGTSIDFTSIPSWAKKITVMLAGVSTNGTNNIQIQLGTGATPTYTTSGYISSAWTAATNYATGTTTGLVLTGATIAAITYYGNISICNQTGNTWVSSHSLGANGGTYSAIGGGSIALAGVLTAIRITTVGGTDTFDAGSVNILYEG